MTRGTPGLARIQGITRGLRRDFAGITSGLPGHEASRRDMLLAPAERRCTSCCSWRFDHKTALRAEQRNALVFQMMERPWNDGQSNCRQLRDRFVAMMLEGVRVEGDALPSVRLVAAEFRLNPLTLRKG